MKNAFLFIFAALFYVTTVFSQSDMDSTGSSLSTDTESSSSTTSLDSESSPSPYTSSTDSYSSSASSGSDSYTSSTSSSLSTDDYSSTASPKREKKGSNIASAIDKLNLNITGNGYILMGQIVSGYESGRLGNKYMEKRWQNSFSGRLEITSQPVDWYHTSIALETGSAFPVTMASAIQKELFKLKFKSTVPKAVGVFDFNFEKWGLSYEAGMMEYAFNPDVKNLGNYMYRSISYPFCLKTKVDYIYSNLLGARQQARFIDDKLKFDIILNSLYDQYPFNDFSLGGYLEYTTSNNFLDFGIGICFDRLISVQKNLTDCENISNMSDTNMTFRSTKIDSRLTLDFKPLFTNPDIFGKNDFELYGELAILGTKTPKYYPRDTLIKASIYNRMPMMIGINIPTFKYLDVLSAELEVCMNPYSNDWWGGRDGFPSPEPNNNFSNDSTMKYWHDVYKNKDNVKWTFFAKKSFSKFDIILMVANDHVFYETANAESQAYFEQTLRTDKDWQWYLKLQYNL